MLVLTTKLNGEVIITHAETGEQLIIKVLRIDNGQVRIGYIDNERNFEVRRSELEERGTK